MNAVAACASRLSLLSKLTVAGVATLALSWLTTTVPSAQEAYVHLNPIIARLAEGQPFYGLITSDFSLSRARQAARARGVDFIYADMEHTPLDLPALHRFLLGMTDRAAIISKGNLQPNVALLMRAAPEVEQTQWIVQQALDMGLHGFIYSGVETAEQAKLAVSYMRYPAARGSKYPEPAGKRGSGPGIAQWVWGVSGEQFRRHADLWPLNPEGDLIAIVMVETVSGMENMDAIMSTPGVGAVFIGAAGDISVSMGLPRSDPQVEQARQNVLAACKRHNVACGITVTSGADLVKRVKEGWKMIRTTEDVVVAGRTALGDKF